MSRLCQRNFGIFFIICQLAASCSGILSGSGENKAVATQRVEAKAWWLNGPERLTPRDRSASATIHSFFDLVPFSKIATREINVVLTTLVGSKYNYQMDLQTGKLYRDHDYCPQNDVWKKYSSTVFTPPYTEAIVPRTIDQLGFAQKVIIFGDKKYFADYDLMASRSHRVRVVGGVIEQFCSIYPCDVTQRWLSRIVLVAVNMDDPQYKDVRDFKQLKKVADWEYAKTFMENGDGRAFNGKKQLPAYRVVGEFDPKKAMMIALTKGHLFGFSELQKMRNQCWKLYDFIWNTVKTVRENQSQENITLDQKSSMENDQKLDKLFEETIIGSDDLQSPQKQLIPNLSFGAFFKYFYKKYGNSYNFCRRFTTASNLKHNIERHWFFAYLNLFMELEKLDQLYSCEKRGWVDNPRLASGSPAYDPIKEKEGCSTEDFDYAFDSAVTVMSNLRISVTSGHSEYIEYDNSIGGTHQLLNGWAFKRGKKLACSEDYVKRKEIRPILPQDINWKPFAPKTLQKKLNKNQKIEIEIK